MKQRTLNFKLNKWQTIIAQDTHRFLVLNCGRRAGKSVYCALKMMIRAQKQPGAVIYYVSPSYRQSKSIMWEMLGDLIPKEWIAKKNETELIIEYVNGSRIELKGADAEPDRLRGVKIDWLVCDEVASFRNWQTVWNKVLRPTLLDSKGKAIFISTPQGFNFWYDLYQTQDPDYKSYTFTTYDNDYVDKAEIDKMKVEMTDDDFRQEILAEFTQVAGVVYKEWNFATNFIPLSYDPYLPLHLAIDFGVNDETAIIWIQKQGGEFRVIDFYEVSNASIDHFAAVLKSKPYKEPELFVGDPAGRARSITTNTSPIDEYGRHGYAIATPAIGTIQDQIRITHRFMKSLFVSNTLFELRDHLHNYRYPVKKDNIVNQSNEVPVHDEHSHSMRALEYYFSYIDADSSSISLPRQDFSAWKI